MPHFGEPRIAIGQIWVPYDGKIADITHPDTLKHFLDLETALPETRKIIAILISVIRIAGTGGVFVYPNEGADRLLPYADNKYFAVVVIADGTQRLQYNQTVANDDFDLYCFGYIVGA